MRYLSAAELTDLVPPAMLIAAIEVGLRDLAAGRVVVPPRGHVEFDGNTLLTMPVIGQDAFGAKVVSVVPSNARTERPVTNGLMLLNDRATGAPLAVLNAAVLTAQRTGAVGALGLKYTTPTDITTLGVIGVGVQGTWQAIFACAIRPITAIHFIARSDERAQRFIDTVTARVPRSVRVVRSQSLEDLLSRSHVIVASTTSRNPVLPNDPRMLADKHFISVGSFTPSMQELPNAAYELAGQVVVDSDAAKSEVGDLINLLAAGILNEGRITHLADLVTGNRSIDTTRTTVFKSVGHALYDLYAARALLAQAERVGRGTQLE